MASNTTDFTLNYNAAFPEARTSLSSARTAVDDGVKTKSSRSSIFSSSSRTSTLSPLTSIFRKKNRDSTKPSSSRSPPVLKESREPIMAARAAYFAGK